ncbi:MAG: secretin N-terminal domain-containing protein [Acidobacteriaceae bacterium]
MLVLLCSGGSAESESASQYFKQGQAAEAQNDVIAAYVAYKRAYELKPEELKYRATLERIRVSAAAKYVREGEQFAAQNNFAPALAAFLKALDADPGDEVAESDARRLEYTLEEPVHAATETIRSGRAPGGPEGPAGLEIPANGPVTLHMVEDSRIIYQAIGKTLGVNVLFDPAYSSKRIQVDLVDVTPYQALQIVAKVSGTFWEPVTHNTIFVAQDTRAKRQELGEQALEVFYLKNVSQQNDFTEIQTVLRNLFQTARINGVASENAIVMRGTPAELRLAKMLIAGLDEPKPEVLVDITVMEVSRDKMREIGLSPPTSITVNSGSSQTLEQIGHTSAYSITIGQAAAEFLLTDSDTRILQNPRLRALDGQKADLKLGEKLPVATGSYTIPTSTTAAAAETQFQYLDVGVNIEMTPEIHADRDVTLKLTVELSSESGTEPLEGVNEPIISQEKADQVVRLKNGESTILAGLLQKQTSQTVSGWPGFGEIPLLKYFFSTQQHEVKSDELVFLITPHVVRAPAFDDNVEREIDTGTETAIQLREPAAQVPQSDPHR